MKHALFVYGGWPGHKPEEMARLVGDRLNAAGFEIEYSDSLDVLDDSERLKTFDLISPFWTLGNLAAPQEKALCGAIGSGVGLAGIHGGMGDAFRGALNYEWMVGGHFVGHPHVGEYTVRVLEPEHPACKGLPAEFIYRSEQYYLLVDPGISILADADYSHAGDTVKMPVAWTKNWGSGRVFYHALGHVPEELEEFPVAMDLTIGGMVWAAR